MSISAQAIIKGLVQRALPSRNFDSANQDVAVRLFTYGEMFTQPLVRKAHNLADEGTYFVTNNNQTAITPTFGTAFSATLPIVLIQNVATGSVATQAYIDYITLTAIAATTAASAGVSTNLAVVVDNGLRYSSGGTALPVYNNPNMNSNTKSVCTAYCGAITATVASAAARTICGFRTVRPAASATAMTVVGDQINLNFGGVEGGSAGSIVLLNPNIIPIQLPPVILGPQQSCLVYLWFNATTPAAGSFVPEIGQWER
jgi:hypothetical protein